MSKRKRPAISPELQKYAEVADAMARLFRPFLEVVIHDLKTETLAYIANPFSLRHIGEPSLLHEIDFSPDDRLIGPYRKTGADGRRIRSMSVTLRDAGDKPIGVMCMNFDCMDFDTIRRTIELLVPQPNSAERPAAVFSEDWDERINEFVVHWCSERGTTVQRLQRDERRELVYALAQDGAFNVKRAPMHVARILGLSRATIYNYLRAANGGSAEHADA